MKKIYVSVILSIMTALSFGQSVYAVNVLTLCQPGVSATAAGSGVCQDAGSPSTKNPIISTLKIAINLVSYVIGIAAVIMIIVAGLRMVLSNGDSQTISSARNAIIYALAGILIAVCAQGLVLFVLDRIK
jgi:hypothetical protein